MLNIRQATLEDYDQVCNFYSALDKHHVEILPELFQSFAGPARSKELYESKINDPDNAIFIAKVGDELVGFADVEKSSTPPYPMFRPKKFALLDNIFVIESYRGKGIANALFDKICAWAKEKNLLEVRLKVYSGNQSAQKFYEKLGFSPLASEYTLNLQ